jgi:hypothetical protein
MLGGCFNWWCAARRITDMAYYCRIMLEKQRCPLALSILWIILSEIFIINFGFRNRALPWQKHIIVMKQMSVRTLLLFVGIMFWFFTCFFVRKIGEAFLSAELYHLLKIGTWGNYVC